MVSKEGEQFILSRREFNRILVSGGLGAAAGGALKLMLTSPKVPGLLAHLGIVTAELQGVAAGLISGGTAGILIGGTEHLCIKAVDEIEDFFEEEPPYKGPPGMHA